MDDFSAVMICEGVIPAESPEQAIAQGFCTAVLEQGLRPFLAENGTHGFYTDAEGSRVASFQVSLGAVLLSGNYRSTKCGTGWRLTDNWLPEHDLGKTLQSKSPDWASRGENVSYTTLAQHLETYQSSSKFEEVV